jgi:hypothetical protein
MVTAAAAAAGRPDSGVPPSLGPAAADIRKKTLTFFEKTTAGGNESPIRICD